VNPEPESEDASTQDNTAADTNILDHNETIKSGRYPAEAYETTQLHALAHVSFSSPWPPPDYLASYARIRSDLVDEVISGVREEREYRHHMQRHWHLRSVMGLKAGLLIAVLGMSLAAALVWTGHEWAGLALGCLQLVSLTSLFVLGSHRVRDGLPV